MWHCNTTLIRLTLSNTYQTIISLIWIITKLSGFISLLAWEVFPNEVDMKKFQSQSVNKVDL